jgi:plastocyanin
VPAAPGGGGAAEGGPVAAPAPVREAGATEMPLPPIESLEGLRSDYTAFFQQPVAEDLRRAALKKLFADPHFNQMDMLDVYVDDYTQFEPLPAALRMRLPSARAFLHGSELAEVEAAEAAAAAARDKSESLVAATGAEPEHAVSPDAAEVASGDAVDDANVESTSALTAAPSEVPADTSRAKAASAAAPDSALNVSSSTAIPPGKTAAPDPFST